MSNKSKNILIIDDEPLVRNLLVEILSEQYTCQTAGSGEEALDLLQKKTFGLVLTDINLGGISGIEMIPRVLEIAPDTVILMISGEQSFERAIEAMRIGAFDYIGKPLDLNQIEVNVERALQHHTLLVEKRLHENELEKLVRQRTEELVYLSYHDALTDLPNSILFEDRLTQAIVRANRNNHPLALLYLSIDRFEQVNESLGHKLGYELLKEIARRLKEFVSEENTLARFDGNEFAILVSQINHSEEVVELIGNIFEGLRSPFSIEDSDMFITCSIGISLYPDDGDTEQSILKNALAAHSRSRKKGPGNYQFYKTGMNERAVRRIKLENNLRQAIEREEFEVYYQPKIDIWTNRISGYEALLRWDHPRLGLILPTEFISLAEETGLIIPIGDWVLETVCRQIRRWEKNGFETNPVSINISARQFKQTNLLKKIRKILAETEVSPQSLELELTESSLMVNQKNSIKVLTRLKKMGIKISIDDFGTGYSSLSYLQLLPIDTLKIDRSFVNDLTTNPDDVVLVRAIIELAHNLRLNVVAEGVEHEHQLWHLRKMGCDEWQGYYFSPPVSSRDFANRFLGQSVIAG